MAGIDAWSWWSARRLAIRATLVPTGLTLLTLAAVPAGGAGSGAERGVPEAAPGATPVPSDSIRALMSGDRAATGSTAEHPGITVAATDYTPALLRGTIEPLPNRASPLRRIGRGLLLVPYAGVEVATWPLEQALLVEERYRPVHRVIDALTFQIGPRGTSIGPLFGFESSLGISSIGVQLTSPDWLGTGAHLRLGASYVSADERIIFGRLRTRAAPLQLSLVGQLERTEDRPFYGIGPHTSDTRTNANRRLDLVEALLSVRPHDRWRVALAAYSYDRELREPSAGTDVAGTFPDLAVIAGTSGYAGIETSLGHDSRNRGPLSSSGVLAQAFGGVNAARSDGDGDFNHYGGEIQGFIDLFRGSRVLALRAFAEGVDAPAPETIPYPELPHLGGSTGLRGYSRYRFVDRTALLLTAEYHYRLTQNMEGRLFTDWGSVAPEWERLRLRDIDPIYGIAVAITDPRFPFVAHLARSPETIEVYVGTHTIFDAEPRRRR